jgi:hypothetical protein
MGGLAGREDGRAGRAGMGLFCRTLSYMMGFCRI